MPIEDMTGGCGLAGTEDPQTTSDYAATVDAVADDRMSAANPDYPYPASPVASAPTSSNSVVNGTTLPLSSSLKTTLRLNSRS
jgi:hypothetical protein